MVKAVNQWVHTLPQSTILHGNKIFVQKINKSLRTWCSDMLKFLNWLSKRCRFDSHSRSFPHRREDSIKFHKENWRLCPEVQTLYPTEPIYLFWFKWLTIHKPRTKIEHFVYLKHQLKTVDHGSWTFRSSNAPSFHIHVLFAFWFRPNTFSDNRNAPQSRQKK